MKQKRKDIDIEKKAFTAGYLASANNSLVLLDDIIELMNQQSNSFPRNAKFVDLQIDALEEFEEKLIIEYFPNGQYVPLRKKNRQKVPDEPLEMV
jgi:hypothetical protein